MNTATPLTPFERGQAAFANAISHIDYAPDSDELMQWVAGLCAASDGWGVAVDATVQRLVRSEAALRVALAQAKDDALRHSARASELDAVMRNMVAAWAPIIGAHLKGDGLALFDALVVFVGKHCKVISGATRVLQ